MTVEEIAIRRPVWVATSNLFLDTDVRLWYASVARTLDASGRGRVKSWAVMVIGREILQTGCPEFVRDRR